MALDPEEKRAIANGEALLAIRDTAGFQALEVYLGNLATSGAFQALNDEGDPATGRKPEGTKYWRGYVACARQIVADVDAAIETARMVKEQAESAGMHFAGIRVGSGDLVGE